MRHTALIRAVDVALAAPGAPGAGEGVVVGVSGGPDSTALLDALVTLAPRRGLSLVAAHLDHRLRSDSEADVAHCSQLARGLGVTFRSDGADVAALACQRGRGVEEAGRRARYAFLRRVRSETGASVIAVAHTRDDQAETLLLRLFRGSGGGGLAGMRPRRGDLFRPMLQVSRAEVLDHLSSRGLQWRDDPSNSDRRFARNRVRHDLLPYLEEQFNPRVKETLARTARLLADEARLMQTLSRREGPRVDLRDGTVVLDVKALRRAHPALARLALRRGLREAGGLEGVSALHVERVLAICRSRTASGRRLSLPGDREAFFRFDELHLRPAAQRPLAFVRTLDVPGEVEIPGGLRLRATEVQNPLPTLPDASALIRAERGAALTVRSRKAGDWVRSEGRAMSLKRFLLERRVPADLRDGLPLVTSGAEVLWVPGWPVDPSVAGRFVRVELVRVT